LPKENQDLIWAVGSNLNGRILNKLRVIFILISYIQTRSDGDDDFFFTMAPAMGACCELRFSAYNAPIWTRFFYNITMIRRNRFANLLQWRRSTASWRQQRPSVEAWHWCGRPPVLLWLRLEWHIQGRWTTAKPLDRLARYERQYNGAVVMVDES
jgi:hypothetical protein